MHGFLHMRFQHEFSTSLVINDIMIRAGLVAAPKNVNGDDR